MKYRCEIGRLSGLKYTLVHDQYKNQQAIDYKYENLWRWFLFIEGDYQGDFGQKKQAIKHIMEYKNENS